MPPKLDGYKMVHTDPDGNCLFSSISVCLTGTPEHHETLRKQLVGEISKNPDSYESFLEKEEEDLQAYCQRMFALREWGGNLEIQACANVYRCTVIIVQDPKPIKIEPHQPRDPAAFLHLLYHQNHYEALIPEEQRFAPNSSLSNIDFNSFPSNIDFNSFPSYSSFLSDDGEKGLEVTPRPPSLKVSGTINSRFCPLDLANLPFSSSYPSTYSLLMADSSLFSSSGEEGPKQTEKRGNRRNTAEIDDDDQESSQYEDNQETDDDDSQGGDEKGESAKKQLYNEIASFLRPNITSTSKGLKIELKTDLVSQQHNISSLPIESTQDGNAVAVNPAEKCYIVQLWHERYETTTSKFMRAISSNNQNVLPELQFYAALIIFPYSDSKAMIYGFGKWSSLLNPNCTIPQWGLRTLVSEQLCNPDQIKKVHAKYYRTSNPISRKENASNLQSFEAFGLTVGSDELNELSIYPNNNSINTNHIIKGSDRITFSVQPSDTVEMKETLHSLQTIAQHFFSLTTDPHFCIHPRLRAFIDDLVQDEELIRSLDVKVEGLLRSTGGKYQLFLHDSIWAEMGSKDLKYGENASYDSIFAFLKQTSKNAFPQKVSVQTLRGKPKEFDVRHLLYSSPIEHEMQFYRCDRKCWYKVDGSRFEAIKLSLREIKIAPGDLHLPPYSLDTLEKQYPGVYQESAYNQFAASKIAAVRGRQAVLLDRINISLGGKGHLFEFADLFLVHDKQFYLVHVKRADANASSHHFEQVKRCVDFLTDEMVKTNAHSLLLQGVVDALYKHYDIPTTKDPKQGGRITKSDTFSSVKDWETLTHKLQEDEHQFIAQICTQEDLPFFKKHQTAFLTLLDSFCDCKSSQAKLPDGFNKDFFKQAKAIVEATEPLFRQGPLRQSDLKKINIVLAVIDDTKGKGPSSIFKNQNLWELDRTRTMVEKTGMKLTITVVNERRTASWDAFGEIPIPSAGETWELANESFALKELVPIAELKGINSIAKLKAILKRAEIPAKSIVQTKPKTTSKSKTPSKSTKPSQSDDHDDDDDEASLFLLLTSSENRAALFLSFHTGIASCDIRKLRTMIAAANQSVYKSLAHGLLGNPSNIAELERFLKDKKVFPFIQHCSVGQIKGYVEECLD